MDDDSHKRKRESDQTWKQEIVSIKNIPFDDRAVLKKKFEIHHSGCSQSPLMDFIRIVGTYADVDIELNDVMFDEDAYLISSALSHIKISDSVVMRMKEAKRKLPDPYYSEASLNRLTILAHLLVAQAPNSNQENLKEYLDLVGNTMVHVCA